MAPIGLSPRVPGKRLAVRAAVGVVAIAGAVVLAAAGVRATEASARESLSARCVPATSTTCTVTVSLTGGLPLQTLTVTMPRKALYLKDVAQQNHGTYVLGPQSPARNFSATRLLYTTTVSAPATAGGKNGPGALIVLTFVLALVGGNSGGGATTATTSTSASASTAATNCGTYKVSTLTGKLSISGSNITCAQARTLVSLALHGRTPYTIWYCVTLTHYHLNCVNRTDHATINFAP